jgi:hypothetical protein
MRFQPKRHKGTTATLTSLVMSRYWRAADAERVLEAWRRSGEGGAAFARRQGLSVRRLLRWRERLRESKAPVFHPVRVVERGELIGVAGTGALELELRGGRRIRVSAGFDPELLEELVRTVEGWGC